MTGDEEGRPLVARATAVLLVPAVGTPDLVRWQPGPLQLPLPAGATTDAERRRTYFRSRAGDLLYGRKNVPVRWHRAETDEGEPSRLIARELLVAPVFGHHHALGDGQPRRRFYFMAHVELDRSDPIGALARAVHIAPDGRAEGRAARTAIESLLPAGLELTDRTRRVTSSSVLHFARNPPPPAGQPRGWDPMSAWLWQAAAATPLAAAPPDPDDPEALSGLTYLSASWRAFVLRDGIAFGIRPLGTADPLGAADPFGASAEIYARSIYLDALVLALMQRDGLNQFADQLAAVGDRFEKSAELRQLLKGVTEFRNLVWWDDVTEHGVANTLLRNLQRQHRTPELLERVTSDLEQFHRQVDLQVAEQMAIVRDREETRGRRFEKFASISAIAFGLPLLGIAAMTVPMLDVNVDGHGFAWWVVLLVAAALCVGGAVVGYLVANGLGLGRGWRSVARRQHPAHGTRGTGNGGPRS